MVRITEELVRKKSEHNELEIYSLEEVSLHQEDIEKIEHIQNWCRNLKILYLQNNLISKIENVGKLKELNYINLALNNIERVENLEGCESLKKLDLTVNFVGELTSVESLKGNIFLEELYLVGNPCALYEGYKEYVCATLPQLQKLDGLDIEKSERIKAIQDIKSIRKKIKIQQEAHLLKRQDQIERSQNKEGGAKIRELDGDDDGLTEEEIEAREKAYWNEESEYTPEARTEMQNRLRDNKNKKTPSRFEQKPKKKERRLFNDAGDPVNVNEAKIDFVLKETDDDSGFILDVACYKYLETSLIDVDIQPWYTRVKIKNSMLQVVMWDEIKPDSCTAQRSQITGHLVITLPKLNPPPNKAAVQAARKKLEKEKEKKAAGGDGSTFLEVNEDKKSIFDKLSHIAANNQDFTRKKSTARSKPKVAADNYDDDHPDVPPLI